MNLWKKSSIIEENLHMSDGTDCKFPTRKLIRYILKQQRKRYMAYKDE